MADPYGRFVRSPVAAPRRPMNAPAPSSASRSRPPAARRRLRRTVLALIAVVALGGGATGMAAASGSFGSAQVGSDGGAGVLLPDNQRVTPVGTRHFVPDGRLLSSTLSPDGTKIAALTWTIDVGRLSIIDAATGAVLQQVGLGSSGTDGDGTVSPDGPLYSPDGSTLWFSQTKDILRFSVAPDGTVNPIPTQISLTDAKGNADLPSGLALSPDGSLLYVALNGANTLGVIDTASNTLVKQIPVGNAPRQVVITGGKAYVSNEGGRPARTEDFTNLTDGTPVVADPSTGGATTGTVSVVDLATGAVTKSINVGLQPTAEYLAADGTLFVANSNDDSMTLIDTSHDEAVQTVNVNPLPGSTVGSYATSITMSDPHTLLVAIGRDNAIAEYRYDDSHSPLSYLGLIPTDWYPDTVQFDKATGQIIVTNDKGIGARGRPGRPRSRPAPAPMRPTTPTSTPAPSPSSIPRPRGSCRLTPTRSSSTTPGTSSWPGRSRSTSPTKSRYRPRRVRSPPSSTCSCWSRRTAPTTRSSAIWGRATVTRPRPSSARPSPPTSTSWRRPSATSTTSTTRAPSRRTATTGWSRPMPMTTSSGSSGPSTAATRPRAATPSPISATGSSGTMPPRRACRRPTSVSTTTSSPWAPSRPRGRSGITTPR